MADLPMYENFESKKLFFGNGKEKSFIIDTKEELDKWFQDVEEADKTQKSISATTLIYRGMTEAKYKLYTSAQRLWITDEMDQWAGKLYLEFIDDLIQQAKNNHLIKTVFNLYGYNDADREFPILSLLQHYGAPTSLMDWSYNQNVAFFFGTDGIKKKERPWKNEIDDYFSIYRINKRENRRELLNIIDFIDQKSSYPRLLSFKEFGNFEGVPNPNANSIFYISDFEVRGESTGEHPGFSNLLIRRQKPITSIYNQHIIPQVGMFIFNPLPQKPLEEIFNPNMFEGGYNLHLHPFDCFNIHKDLSEYLKRKIDVRNKINTKFIYPKLIDEVETIKEKAIKGLIPDNNPINPVGVGFVNEP